MTEDSGDADTPAPGPPLLAVNDRAYLPEVRAAIRGATTRVWMVEYVIYDGGSPGEVVDDLLAAASRGVEVRVLADEEGDETEVVLQQLAAAGCQTRLDDPAVTTHNKLVVADGVVLVGSHNLTSSALDRNTEASVRVEIPAVTEGFAAYFEALWAHPAGVGELPAPPSGPVVPLHDRQISPALLACLQGATQSVDLVLYALAYDERYPDSNVAHALAALVDAHGRGVAVRVVLDDSAWIVDNDINTAAIGVLRAAGVSVRHPASTATTHAKLLACDDTVVVSDANWSYSGLDLYNGTSLQATDPDLALAYRGWVDAIWATADPVP